MAIADEAQQKALWPYGTLNNMGSKDDRFQQMLQQELILKMESGLQ